MKFSLRLTILAVFLAFMAAKTYSMDYPHNDTNTIGCNSCHYVYGSEQSLIIENLNYGQDIDDTQFNSLCWSCHNDITAPYVRTHSSLQIDNDYGDWTVECKTCHNPHSQKQIRTYQSTGYIYQGTVSSIDSTTLTETGAGWTVDQYKNMVVVPNIAKYRNYNYKITSNTSDTLTIAGPVNLTKVTAGNTFAIAYGKLLNSSIVTPNSGSRTVKLFNSTGTDSFADGNATYEGVCEVCHTQTAYHRNSAAGDHNHNAGLKCTDCHAHTKGFKIECNVCHGYPPVVDAATGGPDALVNSPGATGSATAGAHDLHVNTKSFECTACHYNSSGTGSTHNSGLTITMGFNLFSGSYQGGSYDGQSGAGYNTTTTSPVTTVSNTGTKTCSSIYCHSTGQSTTDGSSSTPTYASPVWDDPSSAVCGTCHKVTEVSGLTSGSHAEHLGTSGVDGCSNCHTGAADNASSYNSANHVNASIDVANTYTAGGTPGNGYGTCSTAACHDDGTGSPVVTPAWGTDAINCTACHAEVPSTGSHQKHVVTTNYKKPVCGDCHDGAVRGSTAPAEHLDGDLDVYDLTVGDLGYPQDVVKGGAPYDSCSTAYCHSTGQSTTDGSSSTPTYATPTWGGAVTCGTCHKVTEASGLTSGSHGEHLGTSGVNGCGDCHTGASNDASAYNSITHVDGIIDVDNTYTADGAPGNGYGTCSTASCHDDGTGAIATTPAWGSSPSACTACHAEAPSTGSHATHLAESGVECNDCHASAVQGTTAPAQHRDGNVDVYYSASGDLGYPENKTKGSAYSTCSTASCHSNGLGTYKTSPTWGTTGTTCNTCHNSLPASGSHSKHVLTAATAYGSTAVSSTSGNYDFGCGNCHPATESGNHRNGTLDITLNKNHGGTLKAKNNVSDNTSGYVQSAGTSVTCSAAYCHSDKEGTFATTPNWYGGTFTADVCASCHGNSPSTGSHSGHAVGIHYDTIFSGTSGLMTASGGAGAGAAHGDPNTSTTISCNICHNDTLTVTRNDNNTVCNACHDAEGNALAGTDLDKTKHVNGTTDIAFANVTLRSKAQIRNDITTVTELNIYWQRNNGYKAGATSNDSSKATLSAAAGYSGGTCSTVACHNGNSVTWGNSISCDACHTGLP